MNITTGAIVEITGNVITAHPSGSVRQTHLMTVNYSAPKKVIVLGKSQRRTGKLEGGWRSYDEYEPSYLTNIVTHPVWIVMPIASGDRYREPIAVLESQIVEAQP